MSGGRLPKRVVLGNLEGAVRRGRGGKEKEWTDCVQGPLGTNYLEDYWPFAGGLSAVNAIRTQLRDPINSGLARWRMAVYINKWTPLRISGGIPQVSTRFSRRMEMIRLTRDETAEPWLAKANS